MERLGFTTFGLAMPDVLKDYGNPIQSYRDYYHLDKATFAVWSHRPEPDWWDSARSFRISRFAPVVVRVPPT